MQRRHTTMLLTAMVIGLAAAVLAPVAGAGSPRGSVEVPEWLARIQYPGTSSKPTVYMAGGIVIPARLARLQHPGASSEPTVYVDSTPKPRQIDMSAYLDKIQYPGTSTEPTVYVDQPVRTNGGFDWVSFGVGMAAAAGIALLAAAALLTLRSRRSLAHV